MIHGIDIRPGDAKIVCDILSKHLVFSTKVWVFGSRAKGTARRGSDLDLAVDCGRKLTRRESGGLLDAFSESDLPYRVDVVDLWDVSDSFRQIIEDSSVLFFSEDTSFS